MRKSSIAVLLGLLALNSTGRCAENPPSTNQPLTSAPAHGNRFLFIVETSKAMQPRAGAASQVVADLLQSGIGGQLRPGDTIGLWTYNQDLYGHLPLQKWTPETQKAVASSVLSFLRDQKYEKQGNLAKATMAMQRVVQSSQFITTILITDGSDKMHGTPFDAPINQSFQQWQKEQEKAKMPFITVLRAQRGKLVDFRVTPAPWTAELPPLPPEVLAMATNPPPKAKEITNTTNAPPKPPPPMGAPLIVSGRKTQTPATADVITNTAPAPAATTEPANPPATQIHAPAPSQPTNQIPVSPAKPTAEQPKAVDAEKEKIAAVASPVDSATAPPPTSPATPSRPPGTAPVTSPPEQPQIMAHAPSAPSEEKSNSMAGAVASAPQPPTPEVATAVASDDGLGSKTIWFVALILAGIGIILMIFARRRPVTEPSLISRSLERERKP